MPTIELTLEEFDQPDAHVLSRIASLMLFPRDLEKRHAKLSTAYELQLLDRAVRGELKGDLATTLRWANRLESRDAFDAALCAPFRKGVVAGLIVDVALKQSSPVRHLIEGAKTAAREMLLTAGWSEISEATVDAAWQEYRAVAHLWTAYLALRGGDDVFPCAAAALARFLGLAEHILRHGARHKGPQGPYVLDLTRAWRANHMPLPTVLLPA